jgi:hypothetical protein
MGLIEFSCVGMQISRIEHTTSIRLNGPNSKPQRRVPQGGCKGELLKNIALFER